MLKDKVAIVTGASGGIGSAIALGYAKNGAKVILHYNGNRKKAELVKEKIEAIGGNAALFQCDLSSFAACKEFILNVKKTYGQIDILVNNAGITRDGLLMAMSEEDFDEVLDTNLKSAFLCMKFVSRIMLKQKSGKIINISSVSGVTGNPGQANYCASKAGMIGLTKSAARELAKKNINVNAIAPGFVETKMTEELSEEVKDAAKRQIPLGRFAHAKEIAGAAIFLASDLSSYVTGQVLVVDGGMVM